MAKTVISRHYLRRRADARLREIREWQKHARNSSLSARGKGALAHLRELGIHPRDAVYVQARGKWDRRYAVIAQQPATRGDVFTTLDSPA